jgi:hypothetical protein
MTNLRKVTLKSVLTPTSSKDIEVEVMPFNRRNDAHVTFAFNYVDMLNRTPSPFKTESDAAKEYAALFMAHKEEELKDENSNISCVLSDLRACRTLLFQPDTQAELHSFFVNV